MHGDRISTRSYGVTIPYWMRRAAILVLLPSRNSGNSKFLRGEVPYRDTTSSTIDGLQPDDSNLVTLTCARCADST